ncbi:MAG: DUF1080 domain-containing protein [Planctomycetota bacterium]
MHFLAIRSPHPPRHGTSRHGPAWVAWAFALLLWLSVGVNARADEPTSVRGLFNGRDFTGWSIEGPPGGIVHPDGRPVWSVRDGEIVCDGRSWGFLRYDIEDFADFTLHVEFVMAPRSNSGVGLRCREVDLARVQETRPSCWAYEIQLLDDAGEPPSLHSSGSLYRYVAPRENAMRPANEWNAIDITCRGPRIRVVLNGREIQDFDQTTLLETRDKPLRGSLCLQNHGHPVRFRNVWIRVEEAGAVQSAAETVSLGDATRR